MKRKSKISFVAIFMIMLLSCGDNETHVINIVHEDGSVTRKVTVKTTSKEEFEQENMRVPIDTNWQTEITFKINEDNDTVWFLTADKHFNNVNEINEDYNNDKGSNRDLQRSASFSKRFKWFTTVFRYTETIEKILTINCPLSDFLAEEELRFFYLPDKVRADMRKGPDSLRIKEMESSIELKSEQWLWTCEFRQWVEIFYNLFGNDPDLTISREEMRSKVPQFVQFVIEYDNGDEEEDEGAVIFNNVLGEGFFTAFESEIDSAVSVLDDIDAPFWRANNYDLEIRMPGRIIASNGYAITDTDAEYGGGILWTVKVDYFFTEIFEMWAESKVNNYLIWIITGIFVVFVASGFILFRKKKNSRGIESVK